MAQTLTDLGCHPDVRTGKLATLAPKSPTGAGIASTWASAAPEGYIGWHPGADISTPKNGPVTQPVNSASL